MRVAGWKVAVRIAVRERRAVRVRRRRGAVRGG
jgi:hypothetical protein